MMYINNFKKRVLTKFYSLKNPEVLKENPFDFDSVLKSVELVFLSCDYKVLGFKYFERN